ncbi:hypothetical protein ElyMa_006342600 [Elysia marginata]|uniref:Uncharacterized protein n=1 Tax=Elysia marginata TaxID=1093978 RepID=A0AAV4HKJ5_9GAST|nr:hypothetical protein ElyMa_006342600 [Elysia marginata]
MFFLVELILGDAVTRLISNEEVQDRRKWGPCLIWPGTRPGCLARDPAKRYQCQGHVPSELQPSTHIGRDNSSKWGRGRGRV